jgi:aminopeptidase N
MKARRFISVLLILGHMTATAGIAALAGQQTKGEDQPSRYEEIIRGSLKSNEELRQQKIDGLAKNRSLAEALGFRGALPTQYQYDVKYYDLHLIVDFYGSSVGGYVNITSRTTQNGVTFCQIDLNDVMEVDSVLVDGVAAAWDHVNDLITATLPVELDSGVTFTVTTFYHGQPMNSGIAACLFTYSNGYPMVETVSEPWYSRIWWPCKDYPDDKADSLDMTITYDDELFCTSNGVLISDTDNLDGTRTTHWSHRYPIATYLVVFTMSEYVHLQDWWHYTPTDSMPVNYWVTPNLVAEAETAFAPTVDMLDTLSKYYGLYPFVNEMYGQTIFSSGGLEHQTNTSIGAGQMEEWVIVHELGHQWFGDMITCRDWYNLWLNEAFGVYTEALWFESHYGKDFLRDYMNAYAYWDSGTVYCEDTSEAYMVYSYPAYYKGAWTLHALRHIMQDSTFFALLQAYAGDPDVRYGNVTTEQFRDICEQVSGIDLHEFFQDWIFGRYYPKYVVSFRPELIAKGNYRVYVHLRQEQTSEPQVFHMPNVDLSLYVGGHYYDYRVPNMKRDQDYVLELNGVSAAPTLAKVDRNDWILKESRSETYSMHIIYDSVMSGVQFLAYHDSLIVKGGAPPYSFELVSGTLPTGLLLNTLTGSISGIPTDSGAFAFEIEVTDRVARTDSKEISLYLAPGEFMPGDADGNGIVNISDAVFLISYIFGGGPAPDPLESGDVDCNSIVNIADAVYLIAYIFGGGPPPLADCVK